MGDVNRSNGSVNFDESAVAVLRDYLQAGDGPHLEKAQHRSPIVRRPIGEQKRNFRRGRCGADAPSKRAGRSPIEALKGFVETPYATKAAGERDVDHGKIRLMNQLLGQQYAAGLRHGDRGGPKMPLEETPELPLPNFKPVGK